MVNTSSAILDEIFVAPLNIPRKIFSRCLVTLLNMHACPHSAVKGPDSNAKRRHPSLRALLPHLSKLISKMLSKYFSLSHQNWCHRCGGGFHWVRTHSFRLKLADSPSPPVRRVQGLSIYRGRGVLHDNYPIESIQDNPPNAAMCYQSSLSIQTETFLSVYLLATHLIFFSMGTGLYA